MRRFKCHKIVEAAKIFGVVTFTDAGHRTDDKERMTRMDLHTADGLFNLPVGEKMPVPGDYVVRYSDGHTSWSPAKAFEEGYTLLQDEA